MGFSRFDIANLLLRLPALLWALSFHEFCHGYVAYLLGDNTAARQGRLTLNPLHHLDPFGTITLLVLGFGWAKPVQINSRYFKNPKRDIALVSLAGAAGNFLSALAVAIVCGLAARFSSNARNYIIDIINYIFFGRSMSSIGAVIANLMTLNVGLGIFNLIPIPPLDGSRVLSVFLPVSALRGYYFLERWGMIIILMLSYGGIIGRIMYPLFNTLLVFLTRIILFTGGII
ncbi:MAG: site-2 protease family protein [Synergistaceae bacterium]|nr:site-2 protease family protein [Synergistaceae bacterium]